MNEQAITKRLYCRCGEELVSDWDQSVVFSGGYGRWSKLAPEPCAVIECLRCSFYVEGYDALALDAAFRAGIL